MNTDAKDISTWECHAGDVAFEVSAPRAWAETQRTRLAEFLSAPSRQLALPRFSLVVHTDDISFQGRMRSIARRCAVSRIEPVPGVAVLEVKDGDGGRSYVLEGDALEHHPGAYAVTVRDRHIDLFLHSESAQRHEYPLRLIREAMMRTYEDASGVIFHAAAADVNGDGVMVCGPRTAGKTTTLACLLRRPDAALLSNDRVIVHNDRLVAVPLPVPTGHGTAQAFPQLGRLRISPMHATFGSTDKYAFTALEFATAFGAGLAPATTLRLVVVPRLTDTAEPPRARRLPVHEARAVLAANCFTPRDEFWVRPWLVPRARTDVELRHHAVSVVEQLAASVPCFELGFGVRNPIGHMEQALAEILGSIR